MFSSAHAPIISPDRRIYEKLVKKGIPPNIIIIISIPNTKPKASPSPISKNPEKSTWRRKLPKVSRAERPAIP